MRRRKILLLLILIIVTLVSYAGYQWNPVLYSSEESSNYEAYKLRKRYIPPELKNFKSLPEARPMLSIIIEPWKVVPGEIAHNTTDTDVRWNMIALIKTSVNHFQRRSLIRQTWGKMKFYQGVRLEIVFLVGKMQDEAADKRLLLENRENGDILQMDILEIYKNVVYKIESGMRWVHKNFPSFWLCIAADDDVFPNLPALYRVIEDMKTEEIERYKGIFGKQFEVSDKELMENLPIHCGYDLVTISRPRRNPNNKYYISYEDLQQDRYPPYCEGGWYSIPVKLVGSFVEISKYLPVIWLDDAWLSGYIRLIHFTTTDSNNALNWGYPEVGIWTKQRGGLVYHLADDSEYPPKWREKYDEVFQMFENRLLHLWNLFR